MEAAPGAQPPSPLPQRAMLAAPLASATSRPTRATPRPPRKRRVLWWSLAGVLALILAVSSYFVVVAVRALDRLERDPALLVDYPGRPAAGLGTNFLVSATHTAGASTKADLIMLVHLNRASNKVYLVSLPSDFLLTAPDGTQAELQQLNGQGADVLQRVLETTFDARIDHAATVDYEGFISLTEQLGGVTVDNPVETTTPAGVHFPKGRITVSGKDALAYVADNSDFPGRAAFLEQRQQSVLRAIVLKSLQPQTILNPVVLSSVTQALARHIRVDASLTTPAIAQLAVGMRLGGAGDIVTVRPPVLGTTTGDDGSQATLPSADLIAELSVALRNDTMDAYLAAHPAGR